MRQKSFEYEKLKNSWMEIVTSGKITEEIKMVTNMIRKDVLRTDRMHKFYSGEHNENITILYNILTTYALHHPSIGYCQVNNSSRGLYFKDILCCFYKTKIGKKMLAWELFFEAIKIGV